jgi:D-alanine-D-alanine ligase
MADKKTLAVLFGGISPEHDVSVITGVQLMKHVDLDKYNLLPIYIDKVGKWWTSSDLMDINYYKGQDLHQPRDLNPYQLQLSPGENIIDAAILCFHGQYGEGGSIQGALDLAGVPYQGPNLTSSAICFDKIVLRQILTAEKISQPDYTWFTADEWLADQSLVLAKISKLTYPLFVKPANGGSTIGIQKVAAEAGLKEAIEVVLHYDSRIMVEAGITDCVEINVSVLGAPGETRVSVPEQPINKDEFLSFADKYERGGGKKGGKSGMASASRRIPAPISATLTKKLQDLSQQIFHLLGCSGVTRIDFFANPSTEEVFVIEPNTIPGSMSFYLWEASDLPYPALIDRLVEIAETTFQQKQKITTTFESSILEKAA